MKPNKEKQNNNLIFHNISSIQENGEENNKVFITKPETINSIRIFYVVFDRKELDFDNITI